MARSKAARSDRNGAALRTAAERPVAGKRAKTIRAEKAGSSEPSGLRERKKARQRQQIIETSLRMFHDRGYDKTRIDDIVQALEISQPTFFRYFPSKDAVLHEVGRRAFIRQAEYLRSELSSKATTGERLRRLRTSNQDN